MDIDDLLSSIVTPEGQRIEPRLIPGRELRGTVAPVKGMLPKQLSAEYLRDLVAEDLVELRKHELPTSQPQPVAKIRPSHHLLAQLLAGGKHTDIEVAAITGYTTSRISILKKDPAFKDLMAFYQKQVVEAFGDVVEKFKRLTTDALAVAQERLDESPEMISTKDLVSLITVAGDRAGFNPTTKKQVSHIVLTAADIDAMKKEYGGEVINGESTQGFTEAQEDTGAPERLLIGTTRTVGGEAQAQGQEGQGPQL